MRRILFLLFLLAAVSVTPTRATAFPYIINFSFGYTDPVLGAQTASGWFSFDSSVLPGSGGWLIPLTDPWTLSFTFAGHTFTTSDAGLSLHSDGTGTVDTWSLFSVPNTFDVAPGFTLDAFASETGSGTIYPIEVTYWTTVNPTHGSTSSGTWSTSLPEPGTLSLLGLGVPLLLMLRRRKG